MPLLQRNRERLADTLARELPGVRYHSPEASYLAWLDCGSLDLPSPAYAFFLDRARVALNDGSEFGPPGLGHVRLNFATSESILDELLDRMAAAVRRSWRAARLQWRPLALATSCGRRRADGTRPAASR